MAEQKIARTDPPEVWSRYITGRADRDRNWLMEYYDETAVYLAKWMRVPNMIDDEDLMQAARIGMLEAVEHFDPGRGIKFQSYATPLIRGRLLDYIRDLDWVPRLARRRATLVEKTQQKMIDRFGHARSVHEQAMLANVPIGEYLLCLEEHRRTAGQPQSLSATPRNREGDRLRHFDPGDRRECLIARPSNHDPVSDDAWERLLRGFNRTDRAILALYYRRNMNMKEVGRTIGLSESRVSQLLTNIILRFRARCEDAAGRQEVLDCLEAA